MSNYPILHEFSNTIIVAVSDTEVGKVMLPNTWQLVDVATNKAVDFFKPTLELEMLALQFANAINDLMPKFIRKDIWTTEDGIEHEMMVIERLYALPFNHFEVATREVMAAEFERKLKELHDAGFVHGDLIRPTNYFTRGNKDWMFGNLVQTETALMLIDTGFSKLLKKENIKEFVYIMVREREEIAYVKEFYLTY